MIFPWLARERSLLRSSHIFQGHLYFFALQLGIFFQNVIYAHPVCNATDKNSNGYACPFDTWLTVTDVLVNCDVFLPVDTGHTIDSLLYQNCSTNTPRGACCVLVGDRKSTRLNS